MPSLTPDEIQKFKQRLRQRRQQLIQVIHANRVDTDNKNFSDMTGGVRDAGDESMAAQLSDLNISAAEKQGAELRQVETAWPRRCHGAPMNGRSLPSPGPSGHPLPEGDDCMDARLYGWRR